MMKPIGISILDNDTTAPRMVYSGIARCVHGWVHEHGSYVTDDFGNSAYADPVKVRMHLSQEH